MLQLLLLYWFHWCQSQDKHRRTLTHTHTSASSLRTGCASPVIHKHIEDQEGECDGPSPRLAALTCYQQFCSTCGLSGTVSGSNGISAAVRDGHGGESQNSAAIAERDLSARQSGSR